MWRSSRKAWILVAASPLPMILHARRRYLRCSASAQTSRPADARTLRRPKALSAGSVTLSAQGCASGGWQAAAPARRTGCQALARPSGPAAGGRTYEVQRVAEVGLEQRAQLGPPAAPRLDNQRPWPPPTEAGLGRTAYLGSLCSSARGRGCSPASCTSSSAQKMSCACGWHELMRRGPAHEPADTRSVPHSA